jgi:SAM-dependent methyltransferase
MSPTPRAYWNGVGEQWLAERPDALWRACSDAVHGDWLDQVAGDLQGGTVLKTDLFDEAVGDGLSPWFEGRGCRVVACDLAHSTTHGAVRKQARLVAAVADVRRLPFATASFDGVFSDSTLDHFEHETDIRASLVELARVLKPGGLLLLTMDNPSNPIVRVRNLAPAFWLRLGVVPYFVGVTLGRRAIAGALDAAGFLIHDLRPIMHVPRVLAVPACRWSGTHGRAAAVAPAWSGRVRRFERLNAWPTRWQSGHFVAVAARRR